MSVAWGPRKGKALETQTEDLTRLWTRGPANFTGEFSHGAEAGQGRCVFGRKSARPARTTAEAAGMIG